MPEYSKEQRKWRSFFKGCPTALHHGAAPSVGVPDVYPGEGHHSDGSHHGAAPSVGVPDVYPGEDHHSDGEHHGAAPSAEHPDNTEADQPVF